MSEQLQVMYFPEEITITGLRISDLGLKGRGGREGGQKHLSGATMKILPQTGVCNTGNIVK